MLWPDLKLVARCKANQPSLKLAGLSINHWELLNSFKAGQAQFATQHDVTELKSLTLVTALA